MNEIVLENLQLELARIRGMNVYQSMLAVWVGDDQHTHSIHWIRIDDGTEVCRFSIPVFDGAPDPAVSSDLALIAYAEETDRPDSPRLVIESPTEPALGRREIIPPNPYGEGSGMTLGFRCLAFNGDRTTLRASQDNGELVAWDISNALGGQAAIPVTEYSMEEYPPVRVLIHGCPPAIQGTEAHLIACEGAMLYLRCLGRVESLLHFTGANNYNGNPLAAAFAPDGQSFAVAFPDRLILWGTAPADRPPERSQVPLGSVRALAFHPDNQRLVTADEDGTVRLWNENLTGPASVEDWGVRQPGALAFAEENLCILGGEGGRLVLRQVP